MSSNPDTIDPFIQYIYNYINENTVINGEATEFRSFSSSTGELITSTPIEWTWNILDIIDSMKPVFNWSESNLQFRYTKLENFQDKLRENPFGLYGPGMWTDLEDKLPPLFFVFPLPINPNIGS